MQRSPCPYRIIDDTGSTFIIGTTLGTGWYALKGFRNSPSGSHMQGILYSVKTRVPKLGGAFAIWGFWYSAFDCLFSHLRHREDMWNSVLAGGLSASILVLRSGVKTVAWSFVSGAALLGMIEGAMILLSNSMNKRINKVMMEQAGVDTFASLAAPRTKPRDAVRLQDSYSETPSID
ncbi:Tim17 [Blastocystis hominis]|uniref:Tim17 n=1 Tax=Blastocystis hominis TaxID=12968 RepID=D8M9B6_BLAHO|nr:Tim17 [Blastocystis hominis]CBK24655.2 Tim17 [Blastocystis hominis]|eukprot:XP_012898703.1 Tim17 [Blastocystis hominis]